VNVVVDDVPTSVPPRNTWYCVTPTLSVDAVQVNETCVAETALPASPLGTEGGVVSGAAGVVTDTLADEADAFSAASSATTLYWYVVLALRLLSEKLGVLDVPTWVPFRNTRYCETPTLSVDAVQLKLT
jgi:hypothetical protein